MKLCLLLFVLIGCVSKNASHRIPSSTSAAALEKILDKSVFDKESPPSELPAIGSFDYDPVILSIQASLTSREPQSVKSFYWRTVQLAPSKKISSCPLPIPAHFRPSPTGSRKTFIVLPGAFATWKRGSFTHQTIAHLDKLFDRPNFIAFGGYLAPESLKSSCRSIPWDGEALALDMRLRLKNFLKENALPASQTGLIGYSGGAYLTTLLVGADGLLAKTGESPVFGLGGMAFSPILHARTTFELLDKAHQESKIDQKKALTTPSFAVRSVLIKQLNRVRGKPEWDLLYDRRSEVHDRFYNEFIVVDLADLLESLSLENQSFRASNSYYETFVQNGFGTDKPRVSTQSPKDYMAQINQKFDKATSVAKVASAAARPLFIYFSQDDPVLSSRDGQQPDAISSVLSELQGNSKISVFNPKYGAHTGSLLDPIWGDLVTHFFSRQSEQTP